MSVFFCKPPEAVQIDGRDYKLNTDFRIWIEIEELLRSSELAPSKKIAKCFTLAYNELPPNPSTALEELLKFYFQGKTPSFALSPARESVTIPLYDFSLDFEYIYAAFLNQYGIDLYETELHWWKFRTLLSCINDDCKFAKIISYRSINIQDVTDSKQRQFYEKMKKIYALPDNRTPEERELALAESIECLF